MSVRILFFISLFSLGILGNPQSRNLTPLVENDSLPASFTKGEWLKFRIHYGFINAGYATLKLKETRIKGQEVYHAVGKGWTVGVSSLFFRIKDNYESYFTKESIKPVKFKRRVDEGGYIIKRNLFFKHEEKKVVIDDLKKKTHEEMSVGDVQDMVSAFYYLRNYDLRNIKAGDEIQVDLFFDNETFPFRVKFIEKEVIDTKFGKIRTWKIQPLVQKGRVFEGQDSLTIWITDDENKLLLRIKASLAVGSLKSDLEEYKGLVKPLEILD